MDSPIFSQTQWEDCGLRREVGGREECGECEGKEGMKERHLVLISLGKSARCKCEEIKRFWGLEQRSSNYGPQATYRICSVLFLHVKVRCMQCA